MRQYDVVIIGAGPGGVQLALTLGEIRRRAGGSFTYRIIERDSGPGSFFKQFPVHGRLISNNKLYSGRGPKSRFSERFDWNSLITEDREILTRNYSREFYPRREIIGEMLEHLCGRYAVPVDYGVAVAGVSRDKKQGNFLVETDGEPLRARYVVMASGLKPFTAAIPGIELGTPYAAMKPREHYRDKRVLIVGKGNSGFESAQDILNEASIIMLASRHPVRFAYQTHYVGSVRSTNSQMVENYQLKHHAAILDCEVIRIARVGEEYRVTVAYKHADGETEDLTFDEVIVATGFTGNLDAVDGRIEVARLHGKFPDIDGSFQCRGVEGLYFAGALTHGPDYRSFSSSGFIHGFRYNAMILARHLADKLGADETHPSVAPDDLLGALLGEFEEDAGIYLQPGYIGRCYRMTPNGAWTDLGHQTRRWFHDRPIADETLLLATLEYGDIHRFPDSLHIPRHPGDPDQSVHIHPVIRTRNPSGFREVHLEESLLNRFVNVAANHQRLEAFLAA